MYKGIIIDVNYLVANYVVWVNIRTWTGYWRKSWNYKSRGGEKERSIEVDDASPEVRFLKYRNRKYLKSRRLDHTVDNLVS